MKSFIKQKAAYTKGFHMSDHKELWLTKFLSRLTFSRLFSISLSPFEFDGLDASTGVAKGNLKFDSKTGKTVGKLSPQAFRKG